jgi:hypothetical protein
MCSTAICYLDFFHRPYVLQPQRFKGWFFPRHQVKPTLLGPVDRANLYRWTFRDEKMCDVKFFYASQAYVFFLVTQNITFIRFCNKQAF